MEEVKVSLVRLCRFPRDLGSHLILTFNFTIHFPALPHYLDYTLFKDLPKELAPCINYKHKKTASSEAGTERFLATHDAHARDNAEGALSIPATASAKTRALARIASVSSTASIR